MLFTQFKKVYMRLGLLVVILLMFSIKVFPWDNSVFGFISAIDVTGGNNYSLRVSLKDGQKICGEHTWAYLNESDDNYQSYLSVILAAKMADKKITLYVNKEAASGNGYCHIGYISVQ
jgi:hypothetical protein